MRKVFITVLSALSVVLGLMPLGIAAQAANAGTAVVAQATPVPGTVEVVRLTSRATDMSRKLERCVARAKKYETRPEDPRAKCTGKVLVRVKAVARAYCPAPLIGGTATARVKVTERIRVRAFAVAVGSVARVRAETKIRDRVRAKALARVDCVAPQVAPSPAPTPTPTTTCPPGSIYNPATGTCAKDGSTTPVPPPSAPGPNPAPSDTVSAQCYWEDTGLPVDPALVINGQCPPGSRRF